MKKFLLFLFSLPFWITTAALLAGGWYYAFTGTSIYYAADGSRWGALVAIELLAMFPAMPWFMDMFD